MTPPGQLTARPRGRRAADPRLRFDQRLVLNQWLLRLFEARDLDGLGEALKDPALEGFDEDNVSRFYRQLTGVLFERPSLPGDLLLGYDQNIVRHWQAITEPRTRGGRPIHPKYFQYLALLFTEIYLDRYFRDPEGLLRELNLQAAAFNAAVPPADRVEPFLPEQLNKLAFWMATGSGKTLLMHVNILQYRHYLQLHQRERELNRILLLTPNEGLSRQHRDEFALSGMEAELFSKDGRGLFAGQSVEIIDINKLREDMGEKTVAVDAFEGNNLVLVDEGHRGASGADWMGKRNRLCESGFSFEYSATFGQAMKAANKPALTQEYARCILFDYSYKYFYRDGYGKDYHILNLEDDRRGEVRRLYLTACLLIFYQQLRLFRERQESFRPYLIERPLWVFVGGSVNAVRIQDGRRVSDVVDILLFLSEFIRERADTIGWIKRLLEGRAGLLDPRGHEIFANAFAYLAREDAAALYDDVLETLFNAPTPASVHVENLKGTDGEIALRLGENPPFGVINVGDPANLCKLCEGHPDLVVADRDFAGSLFRQLSRADTPIKLLIGSKKFTEGWNSWRVSTMGLMNVGRSEGSEIIQLFGRGVRLKGYDFCLKRSKKVAGVRHPQHVQLLETLNIFGIRADYMRQFKELLEEEGVPPNEERIEFVLPVLRRKELPRLRMIRLKQGADFKRDGPKPTLGPPDGSLGRSLITVDWYPKIQSEKSLGLRAAADVAVRDEGKLTTAHLAFMDMDALFFEIERFKNERSWYNLSLPRAAIGELLHAPDWYRLYIPGEELALTDFGRVRLWQEIAATLLKKYCDRYYRHRKNEYEMPRLEYRDLSPDDPNFIDGYRFLVEASEETLLERLRRLKEQVEQGVLRELQATNFFSIPFGAHLYEPLIYLKSDLVEVRPVPLNEGERDFVLALREFFNSRRPFFKERELYLLRNMTRGRGIGFFEAGNFYPDFILWLLAGGRQYVTFVDPKGIRNLQGPDDPKIGFHRTVKDLQRRLGDPSVALNSFILSRTPAREIGWWDGGMSQAELEQRNVLFVQDGGAAYLDKMFARILPAG